MMVDLSGGKYFQHVRKFPTALRNDYVVDNYLFLCVFYFVLALFYNEDSRL